MCGHLKAVLAFFVVILAALAWFTVAVCFGIVLMTLGSGWQGILFSLFCWVVAAVPAAAAVWNWFERKLWA
jgi:hypothetical protein